jgi:hypothetical protein
MTYKPNFDILKWGDKETKDQALAEIDVITKGNASLYQQYQAKHGELMKLAIEIYGHNSNQVKYLRNQQLPKPPDHKNMILKLNRDFAKAQELERSRVKREKERDRRKATVDRLNALGYKTGKDFSRSAALRFSKSVLVEEKPGVHRNLYDVMKKEYA